LKANDQRRILNYEYNVESISLPSLNTKEGNGGRNACMRGEKEDEKKIFVGKIRLNP